MTRRKHRTVSCRAYSCQIPSGSPTVFQLRRLPLRLALERAPSRSVSLLGRLKAAPTTSEQNAEHRGDGHEPAAADPAFTRDDSVVHCHSPLLHVTLLC